MNNLYILLFPIVWCIFNAHTIAFSLGMRDEKLLWHLYDANTYLVAVIAFVGVVGLSTGKIRGCWQISLSAWMCVFYFAVTNILEWSGQNTAWSLHDSFLQGFAVVVAVLIVWFVWRKLKIVDSG